MRHPQPQPAYWQLDLLVISLLLMIGMLIVLDLPMGASIIAGLSFMGIALWVWENSAALATDPNHLACQPATLPNEVATEPTTP
jgi:hypothetical protein